MPDCHRGLVTCAKEVLTHNDISVSDFAQSRTVCSQFVRERERKSVNKTIFIIIIVMKTGAPLLGLAKSIL